MTELRDELKPRPEESGMEWTRRTVPLVKNGAFTEEERRRHSPYLQFPDETPDEFFARQKRLHEMGEIEQADDQRERERRQERATENEAASLRKKEEGMAATEESSQRFRIKRQERDVERAVSEFEAAKKRLYRADGSKVYGDEEHAERLGKLAASLREKAEAVAAEAQSDVVGYERAVLASSYTDPASLVPASDRGRLETSRAFVKEDCESLAADLATKCGTRSGTEFGRRCRSAVRGITPAGTIRLGRLRCPAWTRFPHRRRSWPSASSRLGWSARPVRT